MNEPTKSWVDSANATGADFTIHNLPFGAFSANGEDRCGVAIGDQVVDLAACYERGLLEALDERTQAACSAADLGELMALGRGAAREVRRHVQKMLREDAPSRDLPLVRQAGVRMKLPCAIGDYTDFYASIHHATNVGSMFRPDNPLLPNYKYVPIGYHGRASSIVVSGSSFHRPSGQTREDQAAAPEFRPSRRLDYELEVGAFISEGNAMGSPVAVGEAEEKIFGLCLLNDWSARDLQAWEYQPLGPFLAKNFATTVSPWLVTLDALAPFRVAPFARPEGDPAPLPYLDDPCDRGIDLTLEAWLRTARMAEPVRLSRGSFRQMYWTLAQLVAHHASNGCNLRTGDLLGSGTVSGPSKEECGCLLELTWRGTEPLQLAGGEVRRFLEDGDEVILRGYAERDGIRVGFGECRGTVLPARI